MYGGVGGWVGPEAGKGGGGGGVPVDRGWSAFGLLSLKVAGCIRHILTAHTHWTRHSLPQSPVEGEKPFLDMPPKYCLYLYPLAYLLSDFKVMSIVLALMHTS